MSILQCLFSFPWTLRIHFICKSLKSISQLQWCKVSSICLASSWCSYPLGITLTSLQKEAFTETFSCRMNLWKDKSLSLSHQLKCVGCYFSFWFFPQDYEFAFAASIFQLVLGKEDKHCVSTGVHSCILLSIHLTFAA